MSMCWEEALSVTDDYMIECMCEEFEAQFGTAWDHDQIWEAIDHCEGDFQHAFEYLSDQSEFEDLMGG